MAMIKKCICMYNKRKNGEKTYGLQHYIDLIKSAHLAQFYVYPNKWLWNHSSLTWVLRSKHWSWQGNNHKYRWFFDHWIVEKGTDRTFLNHEKTCLMCTLQCYELGIIWWIDICSTELMILLLPITGHPSIAPEICMTYFCFLSWTNFKSFLQNVSIENVTMYNTDLDANCIT